MAKLKVEWSVQAKTDLLDVLAFYVQRNGSATYSKKLNAKINKSINYIAKNPKLGIQTDYKSVRSLMTDEYQIIYEIFDQLILIVMVWDCRRNPDERQLQTRIKI